MMGTKYLEQTGTMTIDNGVNRARCVVEFKEPVTGSTQSGSGSQYSPTERLRPPLRGNGMRDLRANSALTTFKSVESDAFPKNTLDFLWVQQPGHHTQRGHS